MNQSNYDDKKIAIIICVNNERLYEEALLFLQNLIVPVGFTLDIIAVYDAVSMTAGYQEAMESSDAKYKIYMHQDVFVINKHILTKILDVFHNDIGVGIIGLIGAKDLNYDCPVWWNSQQQYGSIVNKQAPELVKYTKYKICEALYEEMAALDGVFLATQYDLPWREDLFRDWHFYDISQTREFIRAGYKAVIPRQEEPWVVHYCARRQPGEAYRQNMEIFKINYKW